MRFALIIPVLNPGPEWQDCIRSIVGQTVQPDTVHVIDSGSDDASVIEAATSAGFKVTRIDKRQFDHGATRNIALSEYADHDCLVYMTQDAVLAAEDSLANILSAFDDPDVAAVCGRQLPRLQADAIEAHARRFNYPAQTSTRTIDDIGTLGLRAAFMSNSFAAYRLDALKSIGGFPERIIFGEDMYVAARFLLDGNKLVYQGEAAVYHSHAYSIFQEFRRYFDMGVYHATETWLRDRFGQAEGEGMRFIRSELRYLSAHALWQIPEAIIRNLMKLIGYRLGLYHRWLPKLFKRWFAMNKGYFR